MSSVPGAVVDSMRENESSFNPTAPAGGNDERLGSTENWPDGVPEIIMAGKGSLIGRPHCSSSTEGRLSPVLIVRDE